MHFSTLRCFVSPRDDLYDPCSNLIHNMAKNRRRTRSQLVSAVSRYLGGPAELLPSEVPTLRDVLRLVLHLQRHEATDSKICIASLARKAADYVLIAWNKSSSHFTPPAVVSKNAIASRIRRAFDFFTELNDSKRSTRHHVNKHQRSSKTSWIKELDALFDVTKCRCPFTACTFDGANCKSDCKVSMN